MSRELEILNAMLAVNGEAPVSSVSSNDPSAIQARNVLNRVSTKIQARGWWFNTERFTLSPLAGTGEIVLPSNTLSVDPVNTYSPLVQRGKRLYDRENNTYSIGTEVVVDIILKLDIDDLPSLVADYLMDKAVGEYYVDDDGDMDKARAVQQREAESYAFMQREHLKNSDVNIRQSDIGQRLLRDTSYGRSYLEPRGR